MRGSVFLGTVAVLIIAANTAMAQRVTDYLGLRGPIKFAGTEYTLAWSSTPFKTYVKQAYLPKGQSPETYGNMVMVEFLAGNISPVKAATQQIAFLNKRRASDPITKYQVTQNRQSGEYILDFLLSSRDANGAIIIEWNGYRYAAATDRQGKSGVVLFGISHRAYGNTAAEAFLKKLATFKSEQIVTLAKMPLPWP
ncbi:MAG: hypothetical protein ACK5KM_15875 [Hyphomicrobiaceae bacterium]